MLAIISFIVLISTYLLVRQLNAAAGVTVDNRNHNAKVLNQAKQALIGYVAQQTAPAGENNPGRLPCPEAPGNYGTASEGIAAGNCTLPAVGRLPWRTLGLDKLLDAASEPLWYVVSPGWALSNSTTPPLTTFINSMSPGQLTVDGVADTAVALIIAPGAAFNVPAAPGCAAKSQTHPTAAGTLDRSNYLECGNATAGPNFVTTGPSASFNDQVLRVATADLLPGIEAVIEKRIVSEVLPALKTAVYTGPEWGSGISPTNPLFPYPALFGDPSTSNLQGAAVTVVGAPQGLLPFNRTQCTPATDGPRCIPTLTAWASGTPPDVTKIGGWGDFQTKTCSWQSGGNVALCEGEYREDLGNEDKPGMIIRMTATINNVAMGFRILNIAKATIEAENNDGTGLPLQIITPTVTSTMNSNGSVTISFSGRLPNIDAMGWETWALYRIRLERSVIGDHALLDEATAGSAAWFVRNQWYRLLYYAPAPGHTAAALPGPSCTSGGTCLSVANFPMPNNNKRAILILMGRRLTGGPVTGPADYLEFGNADLNTTFEQRTISRAANAPFNDRVLVLDANP